MGVYYLLDGVEPSHHWLTSISTPQLPSLSQSTNNVTIDNVTGAPPAEDTSNKDAINPQYLNLTCTPDSTKVSACQQGLAVENVGRKA
jgi:hypothetical protein